MTDDARQSSGHVILTVDLEPSDVVTRTGVVRGIHEVGERLIERCNHRGLAATWAVAEPAASKYLSGLVESGLPHEIALLGEGHWVGERVSRATFARELHRRLGHAQAAGVSVSSFVSREGPVDDHLDVVVKSGITGVRGFVDAAARSQRPAVPHRLHYGMWEIPGSVRLPHEPSWLRGHLHSRRVRRRLDAAATSGGLLHVIVDVCRTAEAGPAAERHIDQLLRRIQRLCTQRQLVIETMRETVARLSRAPQSMPQRSILRLVG